MHPHTATIKDFRSHALTPATTERQPTMLCVPSVMRAGVHHAFGITRDPAAELLGTTLFPDDVITISVSAHDEGHRRTETDLAEVLACIDRLLGPEVPRMLRMIPSPSSSSVTYFRLLVDGERFYAPSPLQDAYLAREHAVSPLSPA